MRIGSEGTVRWEAKDWGTISLLGALFCCNDEAGELIADRGWAMDDRPFGLFERERVPDATLRIFHAPVPGRTGMFDEIDGIVGWYAGAVWQVPGIAKFTVTRYDNQGEPAATSLRDFGWRTKFWNFGARTQVAAPLLLGNPRQPLQLIDRHRPRRRRAQHPRVAELPATQEHQAQPRVIGGRRD